MLRHLYKTLIISIMCGSLTIMDMNAFAQARWGNADSNSAESSRSNTKSSSGGMTSATPSNPVTRDANGVYKKTDTHSFEGTKGKEDNALHIITMLAVGFIGTRLLMYKKWTTDMSMVAVASVAYIGAEIINIMNLKKQISDMHVDLTKSSDGKIDQAQIETLQKLRESYEKVKASIKTRKMLQMGAAAIYVAAAGVAAYLRLTEEGQLASCTAGIASATEKLTVCADSAASTGVGVTEAANCTACAASLAHLQSSLATAKAKDEIPAPSLTKASMGEVQDAANQAQAEIPCTGVIATGIKTSFVTPACTTYILNKKLNKGFGNAFVDTASNDLKVPGLDKIFYVQSGLIPHMSIDPTIHQRNALQKALDLLFPRAEAGLPAMLGLGVGAVAAFAASKFAIGAKIDMYMYTPGGRIIAWGIMAAAAMLGAKASQDEMDKIDDHIKKIDKILAEMNALQKGIQANNVNEQQIKLAGFNANTMSDVSLSGNPAVKTDCLSNGSNGACASLENQLVSMPGFANLPDSFKSIASQTAKIGEGLSGTNVISGSTLSSLGNIGGKANAISRLTDNVKNKLNGTLAKNGKGQIDFDKEEKKLTDQLKNETLKAFKSKGYSTGDFIKNAGLSNAVEAKAKSSIASSGSKKPAFGGAVAVPSAAQKKDKSFDLDFKESGAEVGIAGAEGAGGAQASAEEKYDIGQNDINTNSNESIFEMISNRYIKSGYPKLLEEEAVKK